MASTVWQELQGLLVLQARPGFQVRMVRMVVMARMVLPVLSVRRGVLVLRAPWGCLVRPVRLVLMALTARTVLRAGPVRRDRLAVRD